MSIEKLKLDFENPLHLAFLLTKWMTCVILRRADTYRTEDPKFDGRAFYIPVYKPMMYYLLGLYSRLSEKSGYADTVTSVEEMLDKLNEQDNQRDKQVFESLKTLFRDNDSRIKTGEDVSSEVVKILQDLLTQEDSFKSIEDFSCVFVEYLNVLWPAL